MDPDGPHCFFEEGKNGEYWRKGFKCERYVDGYLHSTDDIPSFERHDCDLYFTWHHRGFLHRENGPAVIISNYDDERDLDVMIDQSWYKHGKRHREDGPARTSYLADFCIEEWWTDGVLFERKRRNYLPSEIPECLEKGTT